MNCGRSRAEKDRASWHRDRSEALELRVVTGQSEGLEDLCSRRGGPLSGTKGWILSCEQRRIIESFSWEADFFFPITINFLLNSFIIRYL